MEKIDGKMIFIAFQMMAVYLLKPALKAYSVAKNISQENKVCNKTLNVVAQRLEFDNDNCFCDAVDF